MNLRVAFVATPRPPANTVASIDWPVLCQFIPRAFDGWFVHALHVGIIGASCPRDGICTLKAKSGKRKVLVICVGSWLIKAEGDFQQYLAGLNA